MTEDTSITLPVRDQRSMMQNKPSLFQAMQPADIKKKKKKKLQKNELPPLSKHQYQKGGIPYEKEVQHF